MTVTDSKGNEKVRQCAENVARVILGDSMLSGKIKEDTFGHRLMYLGQLDWRKDGDNYGEWTDKDDSALRSYLHLKYKLRNKGDYEDGFNMALLENSYNPLTGFLDALEWDGKHRIDTVMTDYLGVKPTKYNVAAFRVFLQVRLGNWNWGGEAESITYDILVDTTNQGILIVRYAIVFENPPGHDEEGHGYGRCSESLHHNCR